MTKNKTIEELNRRIQMHSSEVDEQSQVITALRKVIQTQQKQVDWLQRQLRIIRTVMDGVKFPDVDGPEN